MHKANRLTSKVKGSYIHKHFSSYVDCTGRVPSTAQRGGLFYSALRALRVIGTLSHNHSLNRRRHEQRLIRREATKVSGQEMETLKGSSSARSGIATGCGTCTKRVRKRVPEPGSY